MKRGSKHSNAASVLDFSDFSGGLNLRTAPENIAQNELAECVNMTFSSQPGRLRTRPGIGPAIHTFAQDIDGMYWYVHGAVMMIASGGQLYKYTPSNIQGAMGTITPIGALTGNSRPAWADFGDQLYIASGGQLQRFDGNALSTVTDSPAHAAGLYARAGRLFCFETASDTLRGCAVGDASTWTVPSNATDADPCEVEIGYKVAGDIVCAVPSLRDVIFFKSSATFRLTGEYPDWTIGEVSRDEAIANGASAVNVAGLLFYLEKSKGVRLLQGTQGYEEIAPGDTLIKVNPWIRGHMDDSTCRIWNLRGRNILLVSPGSSELLPSFYEFGLDSMPSLMWRFPGNVRDVVEPDRDRLYLAMDNGLYDFSGISNYDQVGPSEFELVQCQFSTKKIVGFSQYLIKRLSVNAQTLDADEPTEEALHVNVSGKNVMNIRFFFDESPYVYDKFDIIQSCEDELSSTQNDMVDFSMHNTLRISTVQLCFDSCGSPYEMLRFAIEVIPVGVIS